MPSPVGRKEVSPILRLLRVLRNLAMTMRDVLDPD
jgi:hypothetical protein